MKKLLLLILLAGLWPTPAQAAIVHIATSNAAQADDNPTTSGIDSSTANLLVCLVSDHSSGGGGTVSDSKSNTWTGLTVPTLSSFARARIYYATNSPTVGSGHTFTFSGTGVYATIVCAAFSGAHATAPFNTENGSSTGASTTLQPGSVTPSEDNCLVVQGLAMDVASGGLTINGSYSTPVTAEQSGVPRGGSFSFLIQTTATATNPTWTSTANNSMTAVAAVFKAAAAGGGGGGTAKTLTLLGVGGGAQ